MHIRNDSKNIIRYFLEKAVGCGNLREEFTFQYDALADALELQSVGYCRVCCQYLNDFGYIRLGSCASEEDPDNKDMSILLAARAIDFLES